MSVLDIEADAYHAGSFNDRPALSKSIIHHELLTRSPLHAWHAHPKLNPEWRRDDDGRFDLGTVAHALFLEGDGSRVVALDFDDYRTNAAKQARDEARAAGLIPMLMKQWEEANRLALAIKDGVAKIECDLFVNGVPERTLVWEENGVLCKARLDYLHDDHAAIDDLKTTGRLAAPERVAGLLYATGCDVQAAFYLRGLKAVRPHVVDPQFRFAFVETDPPNAVGCYQFTPAALALANQKIDLALGIWKQCLDSGVWPGYPTRVMHIEPPAWEETRVFEREYREEAAA